MMASPLKQIATTQAGKEAVLANIPAFPPVVLRILDLLSDDNTSTSKLVHEITSDPTLSAQVLRVANSALFGFACEIVTVQHAITAIGRPCVQSLVMTVATGNYMRAAFRTEALARCWRHTIATAVLCRELARAAVIPSLPPESAYSFGLLHDIGRLGLLVKYPDSYNEILGEADRDSVSLLDLEKASFGMDHCEAGRILVERWKLPREFAVAAGRHHDPPPDGGIDVVKIVYLACRMADALGYAAVVPLQPLTFEELREMLPPAVRTRFPGEPAEFEALVNAAIGDETITDGAHAVDPVALRPAAALPEIVHTPSEAHLFASISPGLEPSEIGILTIGIVLAVAITMAIAYLLVYK